MEGEKDIETVKIDIHGKIKCNIHDGESECQLEVNRKDESWIHQLTQKYNSRDYQKRTSSPRVSIYRVPETIKKTNREAYDPLVVFLGPYHHKKQQPLTAMDEYKLQAVDRTLQRIPGMTIKELVAKVGELDKEIRFCYEDSAIEWDEDTLAWIMTVDACFILEFLQMELPNSSLVFHSQRSFNIKRREIISDIMKLENQIPLFILKRILELVHKDPPGVPALLAKKLRCIDWYFIGFPFSLKRNEDWISTISGLIEGDPHHLLDLSRRVIADFLSKSGSGSGSGSESAYCCSCNFHCASSSCLATPKGIACFRGANWKAVSRWLFQSSSEEYALIPSAEKLKRAGIKLVANTEGKLDFKSRRFQRSIFSVPQIIVDDDTEIFLRNLVAFEECQMHEDSPIKQVISSNMWIMDQLINSKEDVQLLQRADIIKNYLGNEDGVAKIFNDLCIGLSINDFNEVSRHVSENFKGLEDLRESIREFQDYNCPNTWYIISFVAALLLFVMTILQTIYTMKSYFRS